MQEFISNQGQQIRFADANHFGDNHDYWKTVASTKFSGKSIHTSCISRSTSPISYLQLGLGQTDDVIEERINRDWFWVLGDCRHGGLGFMYRDSTSFFMVQVRVNPDEHTCNYTTMIIYNDQQFYIIDRVDMAGVTDNTSGIVLSNRSGLFTIGYYVITPLAPPTPGYTINGVETAFADNLFVGKSTPVLVGMTPPECIAPVTGTSDGFNFSPGGEQIFNITYQGWMIITRYGYFPFWENIENPNIGDNDDPYGGGYSSTGGGDGVPQYSIDIPIPQLPPDMLINSGAIKLYNPSVEDMQSFMNFIYSSATSVIDNFKKLWANPLESIISFGTIPFLPQTDGIEEIKFCGIGTNVSARKIKSQYAKIDCGELQIIGESQSLLDYNSYTKISLNLPFIGVVELSDDCMDAILHLVYHVDILTGECLALLEVYKSEDLTHASDGGNRYKSVLYTYKGNILSQCPLTGNSFQQLYSGVINLVQAVALPTPTSVAGVGKEILGQKVNVQRAGNLTGNVGVLGEYVPYVILKKPIRSIPSAQKKLLGYPLNVSGKLSTYKGTGFTLIHKDSVRVEDIENATDEEKQMIKDILESGVII